MRGFTPIGVQVSETPSKKRGRKKGSPKTGGRSKGTRNRNSATVLAALDKANIPVIEFLAADILTLEPKDRIPQLFRLLAFCYPELKPVELQFAPPDPVPPRPALSGVSTEDLLSFVRKPAELKANA